MDRIERGMRCVMAVVLGVTLTACGFFSAVPKTPEGEQSVLTLDGALANGMIKADAPGSVVARLRIAPRPEDLSEKIAVNVALVIDTSGSMEGKPIEDARAASLAMIKSLKDGDRVAVVVFHSKAEVLLPSTVLGDDERREAEAMIGAMRAHGTTDMARGLDAGLAQVMSNLDPRGINRVVLLGDGVPNQEAGIREAAQRAGDRGVTITSLGLGDDYNESVMGAVAQLSGGRFHDIKDSKQVTAFFQNEVLRLQGVRARNVVLDLTPGPGVRVDRVIGLAMSNRGAGAQLTLGDVSRNESRDVFVVLSVEPHRAGASVELLDAVVSYSDPQAIDEERVERRIFLGARASAVEADITKARNARVEDEAAMAQAAASTVEAIQMARSGHPIEARVLLERAADETERRAKESGNAELKKKAEIMRALSGDLPSVSAAPQGGSPEPSSEAAPSEAPSPSPAAGYEFSNESLDAPPVGASSEAGRAAPPRPMPARPKGAKPSRSVREAYDDAMQTLY